MRAREIFGTQHAPASHFVDQQLANVLAFVVYHRGAVEHRICAAARLSVIAERQRERVRVGDGPSLELEAREASADGARDVDDVVDATDDVVVVARDGRIRLDSAGAGPEVARAVL